MVREDFTKSEIFVRACLDERQTAAFERMRDGLRADFRSWVDEQYQDLKRLSESPSALEAVLDRESLPKGLVCEFGVCTGTSTNTIAKKLSSRTIYGFDSFEGLPDDWVIGDIRVPKGFLAIDASKLNFASNVQLVKGFFSDSLPPFIESQQAPIALMHIDCDTYQSTVDILKNTLPRFQVGTVIVFDEILGDMGTDNELKALWEALQKHGFSFEWIAWGGHCWTAQTQAQFKAIKKNDFYRNLKFALVNLGSLFGFLSNKKKVEKAPSAAAIRITSLQSLHRSGRSGPQ